MNAIDLKPLELEDLLELRRPRVRAADEEARDAAPPRAGAHHPGRLAVMPAVRPFDLLTDVTAADTVNTRRPR